MADVKLNIAGRAYDVHCADGQEEQLRQLAVQVDDRARSVTGGTEVRQLLFAALMLADEAQEAVTKAEKAEPQSDSLRAALALAESREAQARDELRAVRAELAACRKESRQASGAGQATSRDQRALDQIASRIEALADKIEQMA